MNIKLSCTKSLKEKTYIYYLRSLYLKVSLLETTLSTYAYLLLKLKIVQCPSICSFLNPKRASIKTQPFRLIQETVMKQKRSYQKEKCQEGNGSNSCIFVCFVFFSDSLMYQLPAPERGHEFLCCVGVGIL